MSPRIRVLPDSLVNLIAAGEVVERPASIVKELLENSLDASSSRITVHLRDGGKREIRVTDNGTGMGREQALLSIERHATSKIAGPEDLLRITSLGFRGEALPSIAAVGKFSLQTWDGRGGTGNRISIDNGKLVSVQAGPAVKGTSVTL
ncbi:MAG: DNA mismatch repair endonuclease MutL, partial [bacterium]